MTDRHETTVPDARNAIVNRLVVTAVLAMALLGCLPVLTALARPGGIRIDLGMNLGVVGLVASLVIGAFVGVASLPCVVPFLFRKNLRSAVVLVYGPSAILVIVYASIGDTSSFHPLDCALPAFASVCALSMVAFFVLPNVRSFVQGGCMHCGYDLRGHEHERCPECGTVVRS